MGKNNGWPAISAKDAAKRLVPRPAYIQDLPPEQRYTGQIVENILHYKNKPRYGELIHLKGFNGNDRKVYLFSELDGIRGNKVFEVKSYINETYKADYVELLAEKQLGFCCRLAEKHLDTLPIPVLVFVCLKDINIADLKAQKITHQDLYDEGRVKEKNLTYDPQKVLKDLWEATKGYTEGATGIITHPRNTTKLEQHLQQQYIKAMYKPQNYH